jgi:Na+/proline symporter
LPGPLRQAGGGNTRLSVPLLFEYMFPSWFAGIGYAAIVIGALVRAAIMSIAAANLFTRNIWQEFFRPAATPGGGDAGGPAGLAVHEGRPAGLRAAARPRSPD